MNLVARGFTWSCCYRFAEGTQRPPAHTCQYFRVDENSASIRPSDRTPVRRSSAHREMARLSSLIPTFSPLPLLSILQHFRSRSAISCQPVHLSIPLPMFSLLSGSGINLRSGFHFNSGLLTVEALHLCQWVHQAAGVIRVSRHGDRLPVPHADIQSRSLF